MLKQLKRETPRTIELPESSAESITCGACGRVREAAATNPAWQCPCCGKAYAKVKAEDEVEKASREELRRLNRQYLERKKRAEKAVLTSEETEHSAISGIGLGVATFLSGLGSACTAALGNPIVQGIGIVIILGSIVWGLSSFF